MNAQAKIPDPTRIAVKYSQATEMLEATLRANLVPMIAGSPGIGKSAIVQQLAAKFKFKVIDLRLSQCDPTDLLGFPSIDKNGQKARYVPMSTFPIQGDELPENCNGWLLFLDEFSSADRSVQKAAYKLVLDRMVGEFHLHKKVGIICAGNLESDNAIVEEMSTALQSRLIHMELRMDPKEWLEWASGNDIDYRITSFINFKPKNLYTFKPDHEDKTYAAPRTWEFASRLLKQVDIDNPIFAPLLSGTISTGVAREFLGFLKVHQNLPTIQEILGNPSGLAMPTEPSVRYALAGSLAHNATTENLTELMKFITRLPTEFQVVCLREMIKRSPELFSHEATADWITTNASALF